MGSAVRPAGLNDSSATYELCDLGQVTEARASVSPSVK